MGADVICRFAPEICSVEVYGLGWREGWLLGDMSRIEVGTILPGTIGSHLRSKAIRV